MFRKSLIVVALSMVSLFVSPATSSADSLPCTGQSVTANVASPQATVGQPDPYSYSLCYESASNYYTVSVLHVNPDGTYTEAVPVQTVQLDGQSGSASGAGSFIPSRKGSYELVVNYYVDGPALADAGTSTFAASSPATAGQGTHAKTRSPEALLSLSGPRAHVKVRAGETGTLELTVRDASRVAARSVVVCDRAPARMRVLRARRGGTECFHLGSLRAGEAKTIRVQFQVLSGKPGTVVNHADATASNASAAHANPTI